MQCEQVVVCLQAAGEGKTPPTITRAWAGLTQSGRCSSAQNAWERCGEMSKVMRDSGMEKTFLTFDGCP